MQNEQFIDERSYYEILNQQNKNFPEDYDDENGNYINHCVYCEFNFIGYKRRCICKECQTLAETDPEQFKKLYEKDATNKS